MHHWQHSTDCNHPPPDPSSRLFRILAIDGGGVRGIIPAEILVSLEERLKKESGNPELRIADCFDMIAGTSTGGILTGLLLLPDDKDPKRPKYSAKEVLEFYDTKIADIFARSIAESVVHAWGWTGPEYQATKLEQLLKSYGGDVRMSQLVSACLVTSFDIERGKPHFFTNVPKNGKVKDFYVRDVARATSAAPTYFPPAHIKSLSEDGATESKSYHLVDGGVFANNPSLCAYAEARAINYRGFQTPNASQMFVLSLSCGMQKATADPQKADSWGKLHWVIPLINMMMNGSSQTVDYQLAQVFDAVDKCHQYLRLDCTLKTANDALDDASAKNIAALHTDAKEFLEQPDVKSRLDCAAKYLVSHDQQHLQKLKSIRKELSSADFVLLPAGSSSSASASALPHAAPAAHPHTTKPAESSETK